MAYTWGASGADILRPAPQPHPPTGATIRRHIYEEVEFRWRIDWSTGASSSSPLCPSPLPQHGLILAPEAEPTNPNMSCKDEDHVRTLRGEESVLVVGHELLLGVEGQALEGVHGDEDGARERVDVPVVEPLPQRVQDGRLVQVW